MSHALVLTEKDRFTLQPLQYISVATLLGGWLALYDGPQPIPKERLRQFFRELARQLPIFERFLYLKGASYDSALALLQSDRLISGQEGDAFEVNDVQAADWRTRLTREHVLPDNQPAIQLLLRLFAAYPGPTSKVAAATST